MVCQRSRLKSAYSLFQSLIVCSFPDEEQDERSDDHDQDGARNAQRQGEDVEAGARSASLTSQVHLSSILLQ